MGMIDVGELLYEYTVKLTGMTEYGVSFQALMAGTTAPPPEGARFDVPFEGASNGPRLRGKVAGVDYLRVRADGRFRKIQVRVTSRPELRLRTRTGYIAELGRTASLPVDAPR